MIIQAIALVIGLTGVGNGQQSDRPTTPAEANVDFPKRRVVTCEGWKLHISEDLYEKDRELLDESLQLLTKQLQEIVRVVPEQAVVELKKVPLWFSAEYPGTSPRAEYHPDAGWLKENGRDPSMEKGVEFTNVRIFAEETRRMPNFALHELAHAYHDRVLPDGFANQKIKQAFDKAKASGKYDAVEQRFADGSSTTTRAYALSTPQEYFAESSEAFFSTNDFFPFSIEQLKRHDPECTALLSVLWGTQPAKKPEPSSSGLLQAWKHSRSVWINTTPSGVPIDADAEVREFPLCIRLYSDTFPFEQCERGGADLRVHTPSADRLLPYEIETWDPTNGFALLWVRVPVIRGNQRQELKLYWGKPGVSPESSGERVFNESNGFVTVWHFADRIVDSTGLLQATDHGTKSAEGPLGLARAFSTGQGIDAGKTITGLPAGASPHTTEAWVRVDQPNSTLLAWGNEKAQGKVVMQHRSPSRINMDCYFSGANIATDSNITLGTWKQIVHTYSPQSTRIYVDGNLVAEKLRQQPTLAIESPARFSIGGWYDRYDFEGAIDEVRVSNVQRDANWVRLQFENQRPGSPLVGTAVVPGDEFSVSPQQLELDEGTIGMVTAIAKGAEKLSWEIHRGGATQMIAADRLRCAIEAGRVAKDDSFTVVLNALYPDGMRSIRIPVTVRDRIPEPELSEIIAPLDWDGRTELVLRPQVTNQKALDDAGGGELKYEWETSGVAIAMRTQADKLILTRAQGDGELQVRLKVHNDGPPATATASIKILQPPRDQEMWVPRPVTAKHRPRDGQFIPRDGWGNGQTKTGTIVYAGDVDDEATLTWKPKRLIARLFAGDELIAETATEPNRDGTYSISLQIPAALRNYRSELVATNGDDEKTLHQANDLLCGDVYLIVGQSNAVATDFGKDNDPDPSRWVRTFGTTSTDRNEARRDLWGDAKARAEGGELAIGYWGLELAKALVDKQQIPICILNGAVGGTRIDQHQRNVDDPTDVETIYGRLLWRAREAGVAHGVRGVFWHQGENDQGADGPTNRFGYETYETYFVRLAAAWKEDYPNTEHYFTFQIWPKACAMGLDGSDNRLRDVQRRLPRLFSNLSIVSTLGIQPPGGCHYPAEGYAEFARLMLPLVRQHVYGVKPIVPVDSPNLRQARWKTADRKTIELVFDSPMTWNDRCVDMFYIGTRRLDIESGYVEGERIVLRLKQPIAGAGSEPALLTYVDSDSWGQDRLLFGVNGRAVLTFCDVPILEPPPADR
jgi:hypothetical protein